MRDVNIASVFNLLEKANKDTKAGLSAISECAESLLATKAFQRSPELKEAFKKMLDAYDAIIGDNGIYDEIVDLLDSVPISAFTSKPSISKDDLDASMEFEDSEDVGEDMLDDEQPQMVDTDQPAPESEDSIIEAYRRQNKLSGSALDKLFEDTPKQRKNTRNKLFDMDEIQESGSHIQLGDFAGMEGHLAAKKKSQSVFAKIDETFARNEGRNASNVSSFSGDMLWDSLQDFQGDVKDAGEIKVLNTQASR